MLSKILTKKVIAILQDTWAFIILLCISFYLREDDALYTIFDLLYPEKFIAILKIWTDSQNMTKQIVIKVAVTTLSLSFFVAGLSTFVVIMSHLLFPKAAKIGYHIALPFVVYNARSMFESRYAIFTAVFCSGVYSIYGLLKTFINFDSLAYDISRKQAPFLLSQSLGFYFKILIQIPILVFDVFILRMSDFPTSSLHKKFIFYFYILTFLYMNAYSIRATFTSYFAKRLHIASEPSSVLDILYYYFNSRCFAVWKAITLVFSAASSAYYSITSKRSDQANYFEYNRSCFYVCNLKKKSFIQYMLFTKTNVWCGDLRKNFTRINLIEDLIPSMIISWIFLFQTISFIQTSFIRFYESLVLSITHFLVIIEIFNSYIFLALYKSSCSNDTPKVRQMTNTPNLKIENEDVMTVREQFTPL